MSEHSNNKMSSKKRCNDYLVLSSTYGNRGATEIFCDRSNGHKGRDKGVNQRIYWRI